MKVPRRRDPPAVAAPDFDADLILRHELPGPGYISYPTPRHFGPFTPAEHAEAVSRACTSDAVAPLSLYLHVPLCASPCFWCGCSKLQSCESSVAARYVEALGREIDLQATLLPVARPIEQLYAGGTPVSLSDDQLEGLMAHLSRRFGFAKPDRREFSIEIDLRAFDRGRLPRLAAMGFNRVVVSIQDPGDDKLPPLEAELAIAAREAGIRSVAVDLVYGLPHQVPEEFAALLERVVESQPDRIALFGYLHLAAGFKARQTADGEPLPDAATRLKLLEHAVVRLARAGYEYIGTDHFARPGDELSTAAREGRLQRNFQGYATRAGLDLLGLGATAISRIGGAYSQNARTVDEYLAALGEGRLATVRGRRLSNDDQLRATVIERILCGREVRYQVLEAKHGVHFRTHFQAALRQLKPAARDRLVQLLPDRMSVTHRGRYLLRSLASFFDAYLEPEASAPVAKPPRAA